MKTYEQQNIQQQSIFIPYVLNGAITNDLEEKGFNHIQNLFSYGELLSNDWKEFKDHWNYLAQDDFMKDGGKYRTRRYSVFSWDNQNKEILLESHQPHYQTLDYNSLNGGIHRYFEPFQLSAIFNPCMSRILGFTTSVCNEYLGDSDWHIEAHQFRIECGNDIIGNPTPEGIHRDGRDFICILFIDKFNVIGGKTTIYDLQKHPIKSLTMEVPSECVFIDDHKLFHDVSQIKCIDSNINGYRDVLVLTFLDKRKKPYLAH